MFVGNANERGKVGTTSERGKKNFSLRSSLKKACRGCPTRCSLRLSISACWFQRPHPPSPPRRLRHSLQVPQLPFSLAASGDKCKRDGKQQAGMDHDSDSLDARKKKRVMTSVSRVYPNVCVDRPPEYRCAAASMRSRIRSAFVLAPFSAPFARQCSGGNGRMYRPFSTLRSHHSPSFLRLALTRAATMRHCKSSGATRSTTR